MPGNISNARKHFYGGFLLAPLSMSVRRYQFIGRDEY